MKNTYILKSYALSAQNSLKSLSSKKVSRAIKSEDVLDWVHLDANNEKTKIWLEKECSYLDPVIIEGLLAEETRPRVTQVKQGVLIILRTVNLNKNSDPDDMVSIRLWVDQYRIISLQKRDSKAIGDLEEEIKSGRIIENSGEFLCLLLDLINKRTEPVLADLDEEMDDVEKKLLKSSNKELRDQLAEIRKQAIAFRRYIIPQRDALGHLRIIDLRWLDERARLHLQENYDQLMRYVEDLDAMREKAQIIKDELSNEISYKINKNMYLMSVIAAIFLPLSFLTGLLGINIAGIPGAQNPNAFYVFVSILFILVALQILIFKKLKLFN